MRRLLGLLGLMISVSVTAENIAIVGTVQKTLPIENATMAHQVPRQLESQEISLLKVELSNQAREKIAVRANRFLARSQIKIAQETDQGKTMQLGMNDTPVLNQGSHGTCVTFAITAALDAALGRGDYISQVCQLQLGSYLARQGYVNSGWDGTWGRYVLGQIENFGFVNKNRQMRFGCGELKEYPLNQYDYSGYISLEFFHQYSETLGMNVTWSTILDVFDAFHDEMDGDKVLQQVKKTIDASDRVVFGVLFVDHDQGLVGALGTHNKKYDTWVLTPEIAEDLQGSVDYAGHEMIITGYDDNAIATDSDNNSYRGLLKLRNSWGDRVGDHGDFYMSYDYFKTLVIEAQRIRKAH